MVRVFDNDVINRDEFIGEATMSIASLPSKEMQDVALNTSGNLFISAGTPIELQALGLKDANGDRLRDEQLLVFEEVQQVAKEVSFTLAADQDDLFENNAFTRFEGVPLQITRFVVKEGTILNLMSEVASKSDNPRFLFGKYEYREKCFEELGPFCPFSLYWSSFSNSTHYMIGGYSDRYTRIVRVDGGGSENWLVAEFTSVEQQKGMQGRAKLGETFTVTLTGYKRASVMGKVEMVFEVHDHVPEGRA